MSTSAEPQDDKPARRDSQATQIIRAVNLRGAELFHTAIGDPYLTVPVEGHHETYPLCSRAG